jgi:hypothetical protein
VWKQTVFWSGEILQVWIGKSVVGKEQSGNGVDDIHIRWQQLA